MQTISAIFLGVLLALRILLGKLVTRLSLHSAGDEPRSRGAVFLVTDRCRTAAGLPRGQASDRVARLSGDVTA